MRIKFFGKVYYITKRFKTIWIIISIILLALFGWYLSVKDNSININNDEIASTVDIPTAAKPTPELALIHVYITGCVSIPQVLELSEGCIVKDAVDKAGGFTENADQQAINLAYKLSDNIMIKIPSIDESSIDKQNWIINGFQPGDNNDITNGGKVNINSATDKDLMQLPGVGESTAKSIVAYRDKNGEFSCIDDIMKVAGIKQAKFDALKDYITV